MKRILYIHPHFTVPGGAGRFVIETARELVNRGWDVHIACARRDPRVASDCEGVTFHEWGGPLSSSLSFWFSIPRIILKVEGLIEDLAPRVLFSQVFPANWIGFLIKWRKPNVRHVWMCQEPSAFIHSPRWISALPWSPAGIGARVLQPLLSLIDRKLAHRVDEVFANSQFSRALALRVYGYEPSRVGVSYPGVDLTRFIPPLGTSDLFAKKGGQIVTCGRLTSFKNVDVIILAVVQTRRIPGFEHISLVIIGMGEAEATLRALVEREHASQFISFRGSLSDPDMVKTLQESEVMVHAAEEEPFGLAPVEAMACGTPCIAIAGGGPAETIIHGETGYLCERATAQEISNALRATIAPGGGEVPVSMQAVERAKFFSWTRGVDSLERVFLGR